MADDPKNKIFHYTFPPFTNPSAAKTQKPANLPANLSEGQRKKLQAELNSIGKKGTPFFDKIRRSEIELAAQRFEEWEAGKKPESQVFLTDLKGTRYAFTNDIGKPCPGWEGAKLVRPRLGYRTLEQMQRELDFKADLSRDLFLLPLTVIYEGRFGDAVTKELIERKTPEYEKVKADFERLEKEWRETEHFKQVQNLLNKGDKESKSVAYFLKENKVKVTKIVALALGQIHDADKNRCRQHALVLALKEFVAKYNATDLDKVQCFAQDPIYEPVDKQVLAERGVTVVNDPRGILEIDETTVVVTFSALIPVWTLIADMARPAIIVASYARLGMLGRDKVMHRNGSLANPISEKVRNMVDNEYKFVPLPKDEMKFPSFGDDGNFHVRGASAGPAAK